MPNVNGISPSQSIELRDAIQVAWEAVIEAEDRMRAALRALEDVRAQLKRHKGA